MPAPLRKLGLAALALALAVAGCGAGSDTTSTPDPEIPASFQPPTRERNRVTVPAAQPTLPSTGPGASSGALTCAGPGETPCRDVCCPPGSVCVSGECRTNVNVQACPAELPVTCETSVSCASGCVAADASGRGNHLTVTAPAGFGPGRRGGAVFVNRTEPGGALIRAPADDMPAGDRTVEAWVRIGTFGAFYDWQVVYHEDRGKLSILPNQIEFHGCNPTLSTPFVVGRWTFLAGTYSPPWIKIFVDGALVASCPGYAQPGMPPGNISVGVMPGVTAPGGSNYQFQGDIDEIRVVDRALTAEEIAADYLLDRLPVATGTRGLWRFDEGSSKRCCPAGSTCTAAGSCETGAAAPACPDTHPQRCPDGNCCPAGAICAAGVCGYVATPARCEVDCGDGTCCPYGTGCSGDGCLPYATLDPTAACGPGSIAAQGEDGNLHCCHDPGGGNAVRFSSQPGCQGCFIASGPGAIPELGCASGYAACGGKCIRADDATVSCGGNATCGGSTTERPGGCCTGGSVCAGDGTCCPGGLDGCGGNPCVACSPGTCCDQALCDASGCAQPKGGCPAGSTACGASWCCPSGSTCSGEATCTSPQLAFPGCGAGLECGTVCCAEGERCTAPAVCDKAPETPPACPPELPVACETGIGCCPEGYDCTGPGGTCVHVDPKPAPSGPPGARCDDDSACGTGEVCAGSGCCPADHPVACGSSCCLPGAACVNGACECPGGSPDCNGVCCGSPLYCDAGVCTSLCYDGKYPVQCGASCCGPESTCTSGSCVCPATHPQSCDEKCCLAGASCTLGGGGTCGCPPSTPLQCGTQCCGPNQQCLQCEGQSAPACRDGPCPVICPPGSTNVGGSCVCGTPGHALKACPGGSKKCCLNDEVCCDRAFGAGIGCASVNFCLN